MAATPEGFQSLSKPLLFSTETKTKHEFLLSGDDLRKLAESGNPSAQYILGISLRYGLTGLKIDTEEGKKFIILAAKNNTDSPAVVCAQALCYVMGIGDAIVKNLEKAKELFGQAVSKNYLPAMFELAWLLGDEEQTAEKSIRDAHQYDKTWVRHDAALASLAISHQEIRQKIVSMMATCAQHGFAPAQAYLGWCYKNGWGGCKKDIKEAARLYTLAAEQGYAYARNELGLCYKNGLGVTKNVDEGNRLISLAAEQGDEGAIKASKSSSCCTML